MMSSIELSKLQGVGAPRALSGSDRPQIDARASQARPAAPNSAEAGIKLEVGTAVEASEPPVNNERIAEIRTALKQGSYPLVPTEIADAMIAARISLEIA
ncbi:flagellar biosynthesis anti-sigma factor FlgM [Erythrobacter crassostreae]|uniref:Flagellar biosynthesis anti-sigma factor FlgM n=1 Tax=Erythrobacter crassostreae TaxID=2828328 RepID=A0A9X1F2I5_9SPHN|nr:flagellar biosynthesis anti-sigma factor FlgM [Erythrobacter crassostrea]MBV7258902.1 flagellar biosynthesis anti-sigma factor FlgM [Erythrobacter crassostrea]